MVLGRVTEVIVEFTTRKIKSTREQVKRLGQDMRELGTMTNKFNEKGVKTGKMFSTFRMELLSVMFAGMQLMGVFGGLTRAMPGMQAGFSALGAAWKVISSRVGPALSNVLVNIAEMLMSLPKPVQDVIAILAPLLTLFGGLMFVGAQLGLTIGALVAGAASLVSVAANAAIVVGVFIAAFAAGMAIVKTFGTAVGVVIAIIAALIAIVVGGPVVIAAALGIIIGVFWQARDEIVGAIKQIIDFIGALLGGDLARAKEIGKNFVDGLVNGIKNSGAKIKNAILSVLPDWARSALSGGGSSGGVTSVNDFILTSKGKLIKPHKNDSIMGFKGAPPMGGGPVEINVNNPQLSSQLDINDLVDTISSRLESKLAGRSML